MSEKKKREDAAKALLNMGDKYRGPPSEREFEFNYYPRAESKVSTPSISSINPRIESGTYNQSKHKYGPDDTYATMSEKDAIRNNGMLTPEEMENLFSEAQEKQYQQKKGGKSRRRKSRKSRKSRKNRRKTYRRKN
jgi:hypothetical protein